MLLHNIDDVAVFGIRSRPLALGECAWLIVWPLVLALANDVVCLCWSMLSLLAIADEDSHRPEVARGLNRPLSNAGWLVCLRTGVGGSAIVILP